MLSFTTPRWWRPSVRGSCARTHSYRPQVLATSRWCHRTTWASGRTLRRAALRKVCTKSTCWWTPPYLSTWSRNCTALRCRPVCWDTRLVPWARQIHPRGCRISEGNWLRSPLAERPSLSAGCYGLRHSRKTFPWCSPCSWNSRTLGRTCSLGQGFRNTFPLWYGNIYRSRRRRRCPPGIAVKDLFPISMEKCMVCVKLTCICFWSSWAYCRRPFRAPQLDTNQATLRVLFSA